MLLLIGWRGEPGKRDEPQHMHKGYITPGLLATVGIPFQVLPDYDEGAEQALYDAEQHMKKAHSPYALLVRRQTFLSYKLPKQDDLYQLAREEAVQIVSSVLNDYDVIVSTTGMLSRELFEYRAKNNHGHDRDFLTVGSMGHASSIALGIAVSKPSRQIWCFDGDGSVIMHLGSLATIGEAAPGNFKHVIINNGAHDSVGGQPTAAQCDAFDIPTVAKACGYREVRQTGRQTDRQTDRQR
jgi:phosphonopyruvate decarboxylase